MLQFNVSCVVTFPDFHEDENYKNYDHNHSWNEDDDDDDRCGFLGIYKDNTLRIVQIFNYEKVFNQITFNNP